MSPAINPVGSVRMKIPAANIQGVLGQESLEASTDVAISVVGSSAKVKDECVCVHKQSEYTN